MSRESTPRHAQTARDLDIAVQFNAETAWHLHSSAILGSDSPQSYNRKDYSLWITPFNPRERPNVKHAIACYLRLPRPTSVPALMGCCIGSAVERRNQGTPLAIRPKIMARYEEAAASLG